MKFPFFALIFLLFSLVAYSADGETDYFDHYDFETSITKVEEREGYQKIHYRGKFLLKPTSPVPEKPFQDVGFILFKRTSSMPEVLPQLTVVFPNLSPLKSIDKKISRGLCELGSDVLLLQTGISWFTYTRALSDFNHILRHQMLASHHALNFTLQELEVPPQRIQTIGASLGAILSMALLSIDERISRGISFIGGAGYRGSSELGVVARVTRFLQGRSKELSPGIVFDAVDLEEGFTDKKVRIYRSKKDSFVPIERQDDLEETLDDPEIFWVRKGHVFNVLTSHRRVNEYFEFFNQTDEL